MCLLIAALGLMLSVNGCSNDGNDPSVSESPTPSSPATTATSPTTTPPSESETASEAASAAVRQFFATVDLIRQDVVRPETDLDGVASSTELLAQKNLLKNQREGGLYQVGETKVVEVRVESVTLDNPVTALVDVCWDVSNVDILDGDGKSVVTPERKDVGWTRLTVTNATWETAPTDGWRVSGGSDLDKEPCAAS